ncbi:MAG: ZIP family metal transporter [Nocardiopsaceae bacterium]|jgi:ZIP family zinc transporter|nr:ZIP family metal transporter [Nocardiopsaceae bacterium]
MSQAQTLLLGLIAGGTIVLGLPIGKLRSPRPGLSQLLNALAIGILLFLVWDVLEHAFEPVDTALGNLHDGAGGIGPVAGYGALFVAGISVGLLSLVYYERWLGRAKGAKRFGPGTMTSGELSAVRAGVAGWSPARRLSLLIAVGIGMHNFGEGLAIGASAATGAIGLATVLVIGFALHNATEGFGIVAPLAAAGERASWRFLLLMGLIGGGPTIIGTAVGRQFTSEAVNVIFLTLAAGSILYVVIQLLGVAFKSTRKDLIYLGVLFGLLAGFVTDMIVTAGGA